MLRDTLPHPDLAPLVDDTDDGPRLERRERELLLRIPGDIDPDHAAVLEEAVWERMSFASHLRVRRLGEFTVGTDLLRSESLALVQVILLYHLVSARAALAVGGRPAAASRPDRPAPTARCTRRLARSSTWIISIAICFAAVVWPSPSPSSWPSSPSSDADR